MKWGNEISMLMQLVLIEIEHKIVISGEKVIEVISEFVKYSELTYPLGYYSLVNVAI